MRGALESFSISRTVACVLAWMVARGVGGVLLVDVGKEIGGRHHVVGSDY